jgi:GMP synthase-like glutamine amidotransferase
VPRALILHHDANSSSGLIAAPLRAAGFDLADHFICDEIDSPVAAGPLPSIDGVDLLVALGSRWSVYDTDTIGSWIGAELELLREADRRGLATLGICFGSQALAAAHGGSVSAATTPEIGWYPVDPVGAGGPDPASTSDAGDLGPIAPGPWFQWHLDVFTVPPGAELLAASPVGPQAFRLRRNLGVQFHPELDVDVLELWMVNDRDQLVASGIDVESLVAETRLNHDAAQARAGRLIDWFLRVIAV